MLCVVLYKCVVRVVIMTDNWSPAACDLRSQPKIQFIIGIVKVRLYVNSSSLAGKIRS